MKKTIRCSGVPEHFNLPWKQVIESGKLREKGISLEWIDNPAGTGSLCQEIKTGAIDISVVLLEGAIKNIHEGLPAKIFSTYVESPLLWGVHAAASSGLTKQSLSNPSFAISRPTSGSHLMAHLYAQQHNLEITENTFEIINTLDGAVKSLSANDNQLFLWEKYTTKPLVEAGIFKRIDICPTPWPAFVIIVRNDLLKSSPQIVETIISTVQTQAQQLKNGSATTQLIAMKYGIEKEDAEQWLNEVQWAKTIYNNLETIDLVSDKLLKLGILESKPKATTLVLENTEMTITV